jgi:hypothetical protein
MNMPPSLDDDDAEVILDDVVLEEYDVPSPAGAVEPSGASRKSEKSHHLLWGGLGLGVMLFGLGVLVLARGAFEPRRFRWLRR